MDEIDTILTNEPVIEPSANFAARVMADVREAATAPAPLEFPWSRFLPGFFTSVALVLATFMVLGWAADENPAPETPTALLTVLESPTAQGLLVAAAAVLGSLAMVWLFVRKRELRGGSF